MTSLYITCTKHFHADDHAGGIAITLHVLRTGELKSRATITNTIWLKHIQVIELYENDHDSSTPGNFFIEQNEHYAWNWL